MLPGIQSGISLNMGMTVGIVAGLISSLIALETNMSGWSAFFFSVGGGILLALPIGWLYGKLLNRLKGSEMTVSPTWASASSRCSASRGCCCPSATPS